MISRSTIALAFSLAALGGTYYVATKPQPKLTVDASAVRQAILQDPKMLMDAVQSMRENEERAQRQASVSAVAAVGEQLWTERDHVIGSREARRTVVEFYDYQCQYCRAAREEIDLFLRSEPEVRVVMRPLPVLGPQSLLASKAALAAGMQGRWQQMHEALMSKSLPLSEASITAAAREAGVDVDRMRKDMDAEEVQKAIEESVDVARRLRIDGTPGFVAQGVGVMMGYGNRERFAAFARQAAEGRADGASQSR